MPGAFVAAVVVGGVSLVKSLSKKPGALAAQPTRNTAASVAEARKKTREEESKRRGRRSSILTGSRGVIRESPLGSTQTPQARGLTSVLG